MEQRNMKEAAGRAAADALVKSGMKLGLGTGSTAVHVIRRVGELLAAGTLKDICAFPTSFQSQIECERWGIPVYSLNSPETGGSLDLTIDGADEIDGENRLVKGGGGALLIEKIAAYASAAYAVTADESKLTGQLGVNFPVPLEIVPEARISVIRTLEKLGAQGLIREAVRKAGPVITEHGNLLLDVRFTGPVDPVFLETELNRIPGVVENGFFTGIRPVLYIAHNDGTVEVRA
ncbi:MAG: ribose-5-phosphate isomerase RpiA [Treponema sp.]|jgi:ribose 5-phosphate isomerase A|nr:ribose-5-phosphate isomerase RpiA [Treponema sp.]